MRAIMKTYDKHKGNRHTNTRKLDNIENSLSSRGKKLAEFTYFSEDIIIIIIITN
jgi:hypothetical protein